MKFILEAIFLMAIFHKINARDIGVQELTSAIRRHLFNTDLNDHQLDINRREIEKRGKGKCRGCENPIIPTCDKAMYPHFNDTTETDGTPCTCLASYSCCPSQCPDIEDTRKNCSNDKGKEKYEVIRQDCCDCLRYECEPCEKEKKKDCPLCTVEKTQFDHRGCPESVCVRLPPTPQPPPNCTRDCQRLVTISNECGYHHEECKCLEPPFCTPEEPEAIECHTWEKVLSKDMFKCKSDNKTCEPCFTWRAARVPATVEKNQCDSRCQDEKVDMLQCGSYKQTCECKDPENCLPERPAEIECHHLRRKFSSTAFKCKTRTARSISVSKCEPCFYWKYQAIVKTVTEPPTCDRRCQFPVMNNTGCGVHEVKCICNGKERALCQPPKPSNGNSCYTAQKELIQDSYMCGTDENTCEMCWQWTWKAPNCSERQKKSAEACDRRCMNRVLKSDECGCRYYVCDPHPPLADCWPNKPMLSECFSRPEQENRKVYSVENGQCIPCYEWKWKQVGFPPKLCHNPDKLPETCFRTWNVKGRCGEPIEKCSRTDEECVKTFDKCPVGFQKVTGFSACKQSRDVCIDCTELQFSPPLADEASCYETHSENLLGCKVNRYQKKACQISHLSMAPCPEGREKKLYVGDCDCPEMRCTACKRGQSLDVQLIVDASGSVSKIDREKTRNTLAKDFLPNLQVDGSDSRVALAIFGASVKQIASLAKPLTSADMLRALSTSLGATHTAKALSETFKTFNKTARWNNVSVEKVLVVLTDGKANGPGDVEAAAKLWTDKGVRIFAVGVGNGIDEAGLKQISSTYFKKIENFNKLRAEILDHVLVEICGGMRPR